MSTLKELQERYKQLNRDLQEFGTICKFRYKKGKNRCDFYKYEGRTFYMPTKCCAEECPRLLYNADYKIPNRYRM